MLPPNRRPNHASRAIGRLRVAERLARLPEACFLLKERLHNDADDVELVFSGITYADAMAIATTNPVVAKVLKRLPADWKWPDE